MALVVLGLATPVEAQEDFPLTLPLPHYVGVQIGGSGYFQVAGRIRVTGPLVFELGAFGFFMTGGGGNASLGLSLEHTLSYVSPFVSAGFGGGFGCGEDSDEHIDPETGETVEDVYLSCIGTGFEYTRAGININFDAKRSVMLSLDAGFWYGTIGGEGDANRTFFWPMLGVGFYARIPFV